MGKGNKVYRMLQCGEERPLRDGGDTSCVTAEPVLLSEEA